MKKKKRRRMGPGFASEIVPRILGSFKAPVEAGFVYGSSLLPGFNPSQSLVDLVLVVENTQDFHRRNSAQYPRHYNRALLFIDSLFKPRGKFLGWINDSWPASMYYNAFVKLDGIPDIRFKYGVISVRSFYHDCTDWTHIYCAGRLHKPVIWMRSQKSQHNALIDKAIKTNETASICASLLLLPMKFSLADLSRTIAGLSYTGDIRMGVAEHPDKITHIIDTFHPQQTTLLDTLNNLNLPIQITKDTVVQQDSKPYRQGLLNRLSPSIQKAIAEGKSLEHVIRARVWYSSTCQATKGMLTLGLVPSMKYLIRKIRKRFGN